MSKMGKCENCGAPHKPTDKYCPYCKSPLTGFSASSAQYDSYAAQNDYDDYASGQSAATNDNLDNTAGTGNNRRVIIGLLSFFLCAFGVPYFMLGNKRMGLLCVLLTCCTAGALSPIPIVLGIIFGCKLLSMSDAEFEQTYGLSVKIQ